MFLGISKAQRQLAACLEVAEACVYEVAEGLGAAELLVPREGGLKLEDQDSRTERVVACD